MKPIQPAAHSIIDYLFCGVVALAPSLFNFGGVAQTLCYIIAGGYLLFSLLTNTPAALFRVIPFKVHGAVEIMGSILFLLSPWLFGFADNIPARTFFIAIAVVTFIVYLLTDWHEEPVRRTA